MRVYKFGLLRPTSGLSVFLDQLRAANNYYNILVEIENGRRAAVRLIIGDDDRIRDLDSAYDAAEARCIELAQAVKKERVVRRGRVVSVGAIEAYRVAQQEKAVIGVLRGFACRASAFRQSHARREEYLHPSDSSLLVGSYKAMIDGSCHDRRIEAKRRKKKQAEQGLAAEILATSPIAIINMRAHDLCLSARKYKSAYDGTAHRIEDSIEQAKKSIPGLDPIAFRRFCGEGTLGPQIKASASKSPFSTARLFNSTDARVQIERLPWRGVKRVNDRRTFATLKCRIASDESRSPIWGIFPMLLHREIPDGVVKWVSVSRRMVGPREQWTCEITVDEALTASTCGTGGTVAVHLGWYADPDAGRLRVANVLDELGRRDSLFQVAVSARAARSAVRRGRPVLDGFAYGEKIRSIRSMGFDDVRGTLVRWMTENDAILPLWLRAEATWMPRWKTPAKLSRLLSTWATNRFEGDADAFLGAQWWMKRCDLHHWAWERSQEVKAQRQRKDHYRTFAAGLAKRYSTLVVDDTKYDVLARKAKPDGIALRPGVSKRQDGSDAKVTKEDETQKHRRRAAAGELRTILINAFRSRGGIVKVVSAKAGSAECPVCHSTDQAHRIEAADSPHYFACASCGFENEIDTVFLINALHRGNVDVSEIITKLKSSQSLSPAAE